ncbi:conjugal transfer protein TrbF [Mesorhizobium mediterraneum]|uniref:conjugal transfer protein TrbF n=1 Tax=Mesorhizobium mediterraneum TaxID=43617 RepID=UPI00177DC004|nr:conjugal transfer protein TrbF [Mesorhizobium mediterraneum]
MLFKRPVQRYGKTPDPVTPYQKAGQLWDERIGTARVQARNWRFMAFGCLVLATGLSGGLLWQSMQGRVVPYVVEVDRFGETRAVGPAMKTYEPDDAQIAWHLGHFIQNVRSISTDPVLVRQNWLAAYDFATDRAALFLNEYAKANDPFNQIGTRSISVQVTSVVRASDTSFQVKWTEQVFERGSLASTARWTAILTIVIRPPSSTDQLRNNPLGIFVNAIDWSRELDSAAPTFVSPKEPANEK